MGAAAIVQLAPADRLMIPAAPRRLTHLMAGLAPQRDWLTMAQLAEHGKFMAKDGIHFSAEAARKFVTRHKDLSRAYRDRQLLVDRAVFDRYVMSAQRKSA
jgi:hypothetical protein